MTLAQIAILFAGCLLGFGAGVLFKQQAVNAANEAKLEVQKALAAAKTEYQNLKAGDRHQLDRLLG